MVVPRALDSNVTLSLLWQVGSRLVETGRALLRGELIGPAGPLAPGASVTALYVTMPVYFDDAFAVYAGPDSGAAVDVVWLAPVTDSEADFLARRGWEALEDEFLRQDPDLVDFERTALRFI